MSRFLPLAMILFAVNLNGCYYSHLASGQFKLLWARQPIVEATVDPNHSDRTRELLKLVEPVRVFAQNLGLRVGDQYTSFVDWPGDRVITTLVRTRPGSLDAVPHWFPLVGELPYKGYFDRDRAEAEAMRLRDDEGFDVCVSPISAYSTLGWFADPITSPMLSRGAASLVETILHELVHATAFLPNEADFNESVAQFIGQQAAIRFFEQPARSEAEDWPEANALREAIDDRRAVNAAIATFRDQLVELEGTANHSERRAPLEFEARTRLAILPLRRLDAKGIAKTARLSNACLALRGTYVRDLPRHAKVLAALEGDLEAMIARLSKWADSERSAEQFFEIGETGAANSIGTTTRD
ncbi:MAG: aminopeptidase [Proteobacteria bacterium]|nr:aminopeptidase [Pseudomonadota bacterium]